jgi:signal transduction histidine kinase
MADSKLDLSKTLAVACASLDEAGILLDANDGFMRLISREPGKKREDFLGQRVDVFFLQPNFSTLSSSPVNADGEVFRGMLTMGRHEGKTRTLLAAVRREEGVIRLLAEHDIEEVERISDRMLSLNDDYAKAQFELAQANLDLRQLKEELERRVIERTQALNDALVRAETFNRAKNAFLARMSHELRTPLTQIIGFADILDQLVADPDQHEYVGEINAAGHRLIQLIDDILMMSKIQAEECAIESFEFTLLEVLEHAEKKVRQRAEAKGLVLLRDCDPSLPKILRGDPRRLSQILILLLDNAIKFSQKGVITLRARWPGSATTGKAVRLEVEDEGIGIAEDKQAAIFNSFEQADTSLTRAYDGAGLGLAICRQLALLMGGDIGVRSKLGSGSLFWIDLPIERDGQLSERRDRSTLEISSPPDNAKRTTSRS